MVSPGLFAHLGALDEQISFHFAEDDSHLQHRLADGGAVIGFVDELKRDIGWLSYLEDIDEGSYAPCEAINVEGYDRFELVVGSIVEQTLQFWANEATLC